MERKANGTFAKGNSGKPKGSINKTTKEIREFLVHFINDNRELIQSDFEELPPKERMKFMIDLIKFVLPNVKPVSNSSYKTREEMFDLDLP